MAGKYRSSPDRSGRVASFARLSLRPEIEDLLRSTSEREQRSLGNMASVLVTEALLARQTKEAKNE